MAYTTTFGFPSDDFLEEMETLAKDYDSKISKQNSGKASDQSSVNSGVKTGTVSSGKGSAKQNKSNRGGRYFSGL